MEIGSGEAMAKQPIDRQKAVTEIRLEAMKKENEKLMAQGLEPVRLRNRKGNKAPTVYCDTCHAFISSNSKSRHRCQNASFRRVKPNVPLMADSFQKDIIMHFRNDAIGTIAQTDFAAITLGRHLYKNDGSHRSKVMAPVRLIARIIHTFGELTGSHCSGEEMLQPKNWPNIEKAIIAMREGGNIDLSTSTVLKKVLKSMEVEYAIIDTNASKIKEERMQKMLKIVQSKGFALFALLKLQ